MQLIKQSQTAHPLLFMLVQSTDSKTPLTGAAPTVTLSKDGAAFASPAGAVSEVGSGWYKVAGNATDANTLGTLKLHATVASGDPTDEEIQVVAFDPDAAFAVAGDKMNLVDVDGVTAARYLKSLLAFFGGRTAYTDNGDGTFTLAFKAQDTTTTVLTITASKTDGHRTVATIA